MTEELYLNDCYLREFKARVVKVTEEGIILDRTAFYPGGGGLDADVGVITYNNETIPVMRVYKNENGEIVHVTEKKIGENTEVLGVINWERRYRIMRLHTASHIVASVAYNKYGALITGGHITAEYAKDDFNVDEKEKLVDIIAQANEIAKKGIEVKIYFMPREEALKIPGIVKLAERNPPNLPIWRIVEIPGVDIQADGGPHVKNTNEIGEISILKIENKGKGRKRVYYTVISSPP